MCWFSDSESFRAQLHGNLWLQNSLAQEPPNRWLRHQALEVGEVASGGLHHRLRPYGKCYER